MNWLYKLRTDPRALTPPDIPARFQGATLDAVPSEALKRIARKYVAEFFTVAANGIGPLFLGRAGTYKTHAAAYIAQVVHNGGIECRFVQTKLWLTQLELMRFGDPKAAARELRLVGEVPFLVVDDFATAVAAPSWQADALLTVAEARFSNLRPTLWTANVEITKDDVSKLEGLYGVAFARRVMHASQGFSVLLK